MCCGVTQGVAALMAMNILREVEGLPERPWGGADRLHCTIESMRLAFVDALQFNADPDVVPVPLAQLLDRALGKSRRAQIQPNKVPSPWAQRLEMQISACPVLCQPCLAQAVHAHLPSSQARMSMEWKNGVRGSLENPSTM